jgi:hypothetical protein
MLDLRNNKNSKSLEIILYNTKAVTVKFPEVGNPTQENFKIESLPELLKWLNQ